MIKRIKNKLKSFWERSRMTNYEYYLSQSVDLADLENRMKHGYQKSFAPYYDEINHSTLFYVRGF